MNQPDLGTWWNDYRHAYDERSWLDYRQLLADVVRHAPGPPLLDVGCGYGFLVECARRFGVAASGLEASGHALAEAGRRHPMCDIRQWTAGASLPFDAGSVGAVVLNQVVDHFTMAENRQLFGDVQRVLTGRGALLVYSPSRHDTSEQDTGHVTFFSPAEFRVFVESFGFEVVAQPFHLRPVLGRSRVARLSARALSEIYRPERWAATIDLVALKRD